MKPRLAPGGLLREPRSASPRASSAAAAAAASAEEGAVPAPPEPSQPPTPAHPHLAAPTRQRGREWRRVRFSDEPEMGGRVGGLLRAAAGRLPRGWRWRHHRWWLAVALLLSLHVLMNKRRWWEDRGPVVWPRREPEHRASLRPLLVRNESADACAQALGVPKVALLFLSRGRLHHELTWRKWFRSAGGQLPADVVVRSGACGGEAMRRRLAAACGAQQAAADTGPGILARQHLFSVYVHTPPGFAGFPPESLFSGEGVLLAEHVPTEWGTHTLVEAARELLWAAAADPMNQRFLLLSEADVPLYSPLTLYQQLLSERKSRVNACPPQPPGNATVAWHKTSQWRWLSNMGFNKTYWRKSSQWFVLNRPHAEAVLEDVEVFRAFETHCWSGWVPEVRRYRDCYSDEHYLPTLLALRGLEEGCACEAWAGGAFMQWKGGPHPTTFLPQDVNASLIRTARGEGNWQNCTSAAAQRDAARMFVRYADLVEGPSRQEVCGALAARPPPSYAHPLDPTCALTARKFPANTSMAVYALFTGCEGARLGLLAAGERDSGSGAECNLV